ncbi:pterin-4a-carbinolamine dehydratase [Stanieria sp. NIES-3757]|nr:pterin-4a-carbinolamine dehydratase [Stanieria sp. NIES-3757]
MFLLSQKILKLLVAFGVILLLTNNIKIVEANAETMLLNQTEINQKIQQLSGWTTDGKKITRTFQFKDFVDAIAFVNRLVEPAEAAGHHPDLIISYNKVTVNLTTHDAGGITQKDLDLAEKITQLAQ